jgi:hypothetical protein
MDRFGAQWARGSPIPAAFANNAPGGPRIPFAAGLAVRVGTREPTPSGRFRVLARPGSCRATATAPSISRLSSELCWHRTLSFCWS